MSNLNFTITEHPAYTLAVVHGEAGLADYDELDLHLRRLADRNAPVTVLDLSGLRFISSLGMGALVAFRNSVVRHGHKAKIAGMQPMVHEAFERARLIDMFDVHPNIEAAVK